jgi:REP element-mobilizing transposase RayT
MLQAGFFRGKQAVIVRRGKMPHWRQDGGSYFVTFRLADSLPSHLLDGWRRQRDRWIELHPDPSPVELDDFQRMYRRRIERWLDRGLGSCALREEEPRRIVETALGFFEGERYEMGECAVAGNHVHCTVRTLPGVDLSDVLRSWKSFTARAIGRLPGFRERYPQLEGHFWQHESFDHIIRSQAHLDHYHRYIRNHK